MRYCLIQNGGVVQTVAAARERFQVAAPLEWVPDPDDVAEAGRHSYNPEQGFIPIPTPEQRPSPLLHPQISGADILSLLIERQLLSIGDIPDSWREMIDADKP